MREFTAKELASAAHSLLVSEIMSLSEENGFYSKIFAPGSQGEDCVQRMAPQKTLPVLLNWMSNMEDLWGVRIVEVFEAIQVPAKDYSTALFVLLMNTLGHGISLEDSYDMELAYTALGDRMKVKYHAPTCYEDAHYDDLAEEWCREAGHGLAIDVWREEQENQ